MPQLIVGGMEQHARAYIRFGSGWLARHALRLMSLNHAKGNVGPIGISRVTREFSKTSFSEVLGHWGKAGGGGGGGGGNRGKGAVANQWGKQQSERNAFANRNKIVQEVIDTEASCKRRRRIGR